MSPLKYLVLAALFLGALALDSGTAEAAILTNHTRTWCKSRGAADVSILSSDSATLVWQSDGNLVLEPTNELVPKIWSSGTADLGAKLCWEASGAFSIYDGSGAKIWTQSGGTVSSGEFGELDYVIEPKLSACTLSSSYTMYYRGFTPAPSSLRWEPTGPISKRATLWTKAGICPNTAPSVSASGWCIDDPDLPRTIVEGKWASLRWNAGPGSGWLELVATQGIRTAQLLWQTNPIATQQATKVCFHDDGRLALHDASGQAIWQTPAGTGGTTTSYLLGIDGCNLSIKPLDGSWVPWVSKRRCPQTRLQLDPANERPSFSFPAGTTDQIIIENDLAKLVFQADGNLVLRSVSGDEVWHSGLAANRGKMLVFRSSGDLVIYDASNVAVWSAGQANLGVTTLDLDGCAFALKTASATTRWSRGGQTCPSETVTNSWSSSSSGVLTLLRTPDARLVWQGNGSLVLRTTTGATVWASGTGSSAYRKIAFQDDGNLVIYDGAGSALWSTHTGQTQSVQRRLRLGDHCKLTLEDMSGNTLWTGNDSCTVANYSFERADGDSTFGVALHTHLTATDNGTARLDSDTGIDVKIFGQSFEVFSATAYQTELDDGSSLKTASVTVAGESTPYINVGYSHEFFKQKKTYMVGPVPISVSAAVTGDLGLAVSFDGALRITPTAGLYATVQAGVGPECDLGGASAGIRGTLTILELGLPISLNLYMEGGQPKYSIEGDLTITTLSGSLALYAEAWVGWGPFQVKAGWSFTFFEWTGIDWAKQLFNKNGGF